MILHVCNFSGVDLAHHPYMNTMFLSNSTVYSIIIVVIGYFANPFMCVLIPAALFRRCRERLKLTGRGSLIFVDEIDALCPDRENVSEVRRDKFVW